MITSPGFGRIEQCLSYPAGTPMRGDGQILDPGALPEPYGDEVKIYGRESDECVVVIRHEDSSSIVGDGGLEPTSRDSLRPLSGAYAGSCEEPVVSRRDRGRLGSTRVSDHSAVLEQSSSKLSR
jgi:hypothetical protein